VSRIAFVTCEKLPALTADDRLALDALRPRGHDARPAVWTDGSIAWAAFDLVVLRSCWDYHLRPREFAAWLDELERTGVRVQNSLSIARWNMDKRYLRDLERAGVAVVPTRWFEPGTFQSLSALRRETGWTDVVLKPAVSATAWQLWRAREADGELPVETRRALDEHVFLAQPFMPTIEQGEWSLVFFDGRFTHAVLKQPRPGEFRVQDDFGGRSTAASPPAGFVESAERILATLAERPLYARVDGVETDAGLVLLELELLEPFLFFATRADASELFADAIERRLVRRG
jgi:glutathione synthase/RimK-type ligase-like ATP-grasp enzyme